MVLGLVTLACDAPEKPTASTSAVPVLSEKRTVVGRARNGKGGPAVIVNGRPIYIHQLREWPRELVGNRVAVTGRIEQRQGLPEPKPGELPLGGIVGPYQVVHDASWKLADGAN